MTNALLGGLLIGSAVTLMLWLNGRVTGISGIIDGLLSRNVAGKSWRLAFLAGLLAGGLVLYLLNPFFFVNHSDRSLWQVGLAGFLVGFGTLLGSGCTSGHGICGISRWSMRSLVATLVFIASGMFVASVVL